MSALRNRAHRIKHKHANRAWKFKGFRLFLGGSLIARTGDWMDLVALNWAVLQYTASPLFLGIVNACRLLPIFLLSIPAGMLADRYDRRKLLILIQLGMMGLTCILAYVIAVKQSFWLLMLVVTIRAAVAAMDAPIRHTLIPSLVSQSSVSGALAFDATVINIARIIGPALAGWLLTIMNIAAVFFVYACSTMAVIISLLMICPNVQQQRIQDKKSSSFKAAKLYIQNSPSVQSLLVLAIAPMIFGFPYTTMLPLFVTELMGLGPDSFGLLLAISSCGAIIAALYISVIEDIYYPGKWLITATIGFGIALICLMFATKSFVLTACTMFIIGLMSQLYRTLSRIALQKQVPDHIRGRIISIALMDRGMIPCGALLLGIIASYVGAFWTGIVMGVGCIMLPLYILAMRRHIWNM